MPATTELQARLNACRAVLGVTSDTAARIWNHELRKSHRKLLLLAADLPEDLSRERWENLPEAYRHRIKEAPARFAEWAKRMNAPQETLQ